MPAPAAFVLDFNGTVSDDEPLLAEIYGELFAGIGLDVSGTRYQEEFAGLSDPAIVARGIALAGRTSEAGLAERLVAGYTARYLERGARAVPDHAGRRSVRARRRRTGAGRDRVGGAPRDGRGRARRSRAPLRCSPRS